jgi:hypothetical protein
MTRGQLIRRLRERGAPAQPHHVQEAVANYRLRPTPAKDESGRRIYLEDHLEQLWLLFQRQAKPAT